MTLFLFALFLQEMVTSCISCEMFLLFIVVSLVYMPNMGTIICYQLTKKAVLAKY